MLVAMAPGKVALSAEPMLHCKVAESGETHIVETALVSNPYAVKAAEFRRFRFKAVFIGADKQIEYIKLYSYYLNGQRAVLLHESKHMPPFTQATPISGVNYIYSPVLGHEMQYQCSLSGLDR